MNAGMSADAPCFANLLTILPSSPHMSLTFSISTHICDSHPQSCNSLSRERSCNSLLRERERDGESIREVMEALRGMAVARPIAAATLASSHAHAVQGNRQAAVMGSARRPLGVRAAAANGDAKESKEYKVTVLPGDGIGPEIIGVAVDVLRLVGSQEGG